LRDKLHCNSARAKGGTTAVGCWPLHDENAAQEEPHRAAKPADRPKTAPRQAETTIPLSSPQKQGLVPQTRDKPAVKSVVRKL